MSLLVGAMLVVPPVAQAATTAPNKGLNISPLPQTSSENTICITTLSNTHLNVYDALMPAQFERVNTNSGAGVTITQPKEVLAQAILPAKTVLKKVTSEDLREDITTPAPVALPTVTATSATGNVATGGVNGVLNADVVFNLVNDTRAQYGLPAFIKDDRVCSVVASRAPEIDSEIWVTHTMHAGFHARNLPYWATENVISMRTETEAVTWWLNSPVHRAAILGTWKYACVACSGRSCAMIFTNFDPKQVVVTPTTPTTPTVTTGSATPPTQAVTPVIK